MKISGVKLGVRDVLVLGSMFSVFILILGMRVCFWGGFGWGQSLRGLVQTWGVVLQEFWRGWMVLEICQVKVWFWVEFSQGRVGCRVEVWKKRLVEQNICWVYVFLVRFQIRGLWIGKMWVRGVQGRLGFRSQF